MYCVSMFLCTFSFVLRACRNKKISILPWVYTCVRTSFMVRVDFFMDGAWSSWTGIHLQVACLHLKLFRPSVCCSVSFFLVSERSERSRPLEALVIPYERYAVHLEFARTCAHSSLRTSSILKHLPHQRHTLLPVDWTPYYALLLWNASLT